MKLCKGCGNLLSDTENKCQKCGNLVEIAYVNQPQINQIHQPSNDSQPSSKKKSNIITFINEKYKILSALCIVILLIVITYLIYDNVSLRKKIKLNSTSAVESKYEIKDNTNNTAEVVINADEEEFNFTIPEGTYPKVSQKYVHFIPEAYAATIFEQNGGLSLLNLTTGGTGWIAVTTATLEAYRTQKESLKTAYETQEITVLSMSDTEIAGKDCLVLELSNNEQPTLLIITSASETECYILTITNSNNKTSYDYNTANELISMLSISQKLS